MKSSQFYYIMKNKKRYKKKYQKPSLFYLLASCVLCSLCDWRLPLGACNKPVTTVMKKIKIAPRGDPTSHFCQEQLFHGCAKQSFPHRIHRNFWGQPVWQVSKVLFILKQELSHTKRACVQPTDLFLHTIHHQQLLLLCFSLQLHRDAFQTTSREGNTCNTKKEESGKRQNGSG